MPYISIILATPLDSGFTEEDVMMMTRNPEIADSRVANWRQVGTGWAYVRLGISLKVVSVCFQGLGVLAELEGVLYPDHVRFHSRQPYT